MQARTHLRADVAADALADAAEVEGGGRLRDLLRLAVDVVDDVVRADQHAGAALAAAAVGDDLVHHLLEARVGWHRGTIGAASRTVNFADAAASADQPRRSMRSTVSTVDPVDAPPLPSRHDHLGSDLVGGADGIEHDVSADAASQQRVDGAIEPVLDPGAEHDRIPNTGREMLEGTGVTRDASSGA